MGNTSYNVSSRSIRAESKGYHTKSRNALFSQNIIGTSHSSMKSENIDLRECRDSVENPNSFPIILGLDVTGSMGRIPHYLIKDGLPLIMDGIIQDGLNDPAVLFIAVGDHKTDSYPLQIGQFESGDEELDMWLQRCYLEGRGGGNYGESYSLIHHFAVNNTVTDNFEKRNMKGVIITIGDEPTHQAYSSEDIRRITGDGDNPPFTSKSIIEQAKEKWNIFHIIPRREKYPNTMDSWIELLGENNVFLTETQEDIADTIKRIVKENNNVSNNDSINKNQEIL